MADFRNYLKEQETMQTKMQAQNVALHLRIPMTQLLQTLKRMFPQHAHKIGPNTILQQAVIDKVANELKSPTYRHNGNGNGHSNGAYPSDGVNWVG